MKNKNIIRIALVTAVILLLPLVAMQFNAEVNWTWFDFVVAGFLLFGSGLAYELIARKAGNAAYRVAVAIAVGAALLLIWVNLAVGLIGSDDNAVNLLYFAVLGVGIVGAAIARLRPHGMAQALFATACAQALVPLIALLIGGSAARALREPPGLLGVLALNTFFAGLFVASALLFRRSAPGRPEKGAE